MELRQELRQELSTPPLDVALETVRAWAVWQTEGERRLLPRFARREARRRAWASLRGFLSPLERQKGGKWLQSMGLRRRMGSSIS